MAEPPEGQSPDADRLRAAAELAALDWDLDVVAVEMVSMTENAVFRVEVGHGDRVALRLHRPGYNTRSELDSELRWVSALRQAGISVPAIRLNRRGEGYSPVDVLGSTRMAGVIDWVDGPTLGSSVSAPAADVAELYRQLGQLAAEVHRHSRRWYPPKEFVRRRWDADGLVGPNPLWGRFWELPDLEPNERRLFELCRVELYEQLLGLPTGPEWFGLIHADLHLDNVLVGNDGLTMIDFDDAGFGWYVYELAVALQPAVSEPFFAEAHGGLLRGYRSVTDLGDEQLAMLPAFLLIRALMIPSWLHARPELGLSHRMRPLIDAAVGEGERFLSR